MAAAKTPETILALFARGGLVSSEDVARSTLLGRYNGLQDPGGAEELGQQLADALRPLRPTVVLIWQHPEDIVLAHVIARELGVAAVRSSDADGLVMHKGRFPSSGRVILLADAFRDAEPVKAMCALARQQGQEVVGAGALAAIPGRGAAELEAQGVRLLSLVDLAPPGSGGCGP